MTRVPPRHRFSPTFWVEGGKKSNPPIQVFFRKLFSDKVYLYAVSASRIGWWVYEGSELKGEKVKKFKVVKNLSLYHQIALMKSRPSVTVNCSQRCSSGRWLRVPLPCALTGAVTVEPLLRRCWRRAQFKPPASGRGALIPWL